MQSQPNKATLRFEPWTCSISSAPNGTQTVVPKLWESLIFMQRAWQNCY